MNEHVLDDGRVVKFGNLVPTAAPSSGWPIYGSVPNTPIVPRSEWKDAIGTDTGPETGWPLPYVHDQTDIGMCNASATASAMESTRAKQGLKVRKLSAGDLYRRICFRGQDSGSLLEDGVRVAMAEGLPTVETCPYLDWRDNFTAAAPERSQNRVLEAFLCPTFDACMSAVLSGYDLISGIMWYDSYRPTAATGFWLPRPSGGAGGHAVHGFKGTWRNAGAGVEFGIWHKNSWRSSWGLNGCCVFPEASYAGPVGGWWAVRSVTDEGGVVPPAQN